MKRLFLAAVVLISFSPHIYGLVPLELEATIHFPVNPHRWDVQHAANDTTFGWACIRGDTIFWAEELGDSVRRFVIPPQISDSCSLLGGGPMFHQGIRLLRPQCQDGDLCALLLSDYHDFSLGIRTGRTSILTLEDSTLVHVSCTYIDWDNSYSAEWHDLHGIVIWPALPHMARYTMAGFDDESFYDALGETISEHSEDTFFEDYTGDTISYRFGNWEAHAADISVFDDTSQARFTLGEYHVRFYYANGDSDWQTTDERWRITTFVPDTTFGPATEDYGSDVVAQQDSDGTQRLIVHGLAALDPITLDELWVSPDIHTTPLLTAHLQGCADERIIVRSHGIYLVVDASNGTVIDQLAPWTGFLQYVMKPPGRPAEFVTWDAQRTVRVYKPLPPLPSFGSQRLYPELGALGHQGLTIAYVPGTAMLRLHWSRLDSIVEYHVYSSDSPDGPFSLLTAVPGDSTAASVPIEAEKRFFRVTAVIPDE